MRMEPYHLVNLLTRQLSLKNIQTMKYSYYQNKKQPPCAEVTDEEVANLIRHDEKTHDSYILLIRIVFMS